MSKYHTEIMVKVADTTGKYSPGPREEKEIAFRAEENTVTWKLIPIAGRGWAV